MGLLILPVEEVRKRNVFRLMQRTVPNQIDKVGRTEKSPWQVVQMHGDSSSRYGNTKFVHLLTSQRRTPIEPIEGGLCGETQGGHLVGKPTTPLASRVGSNRSSHGATAPRHSHGRTTFDSLSRIHRLFKPNPQIDSTD